MDAPPPYSETDPSETLSNAGTATTNTSTSNSAALSPADAILGRSSTVPATDEATFTPPYSPTLANQAINENDHLASTSAAAFFDSRPATIRNTGPPTVYSIHVESNTQPKDLPFPEHFHAHGVADQDWFTFVNYLLPDRILSAGRDPSDRKAGVESLEDEVQCRVLENSHRAGTSSASGQALSPLQQERASKLEATLSEWNEGFFKPRGLLITTIDSNAEVPASESADTTAREGTLKVPGSWVPHDHIPYDHEILGGSSAGRRRGFFGGFKSFQGSSQGGFRMGPIVADNDGFRMGSMFVADQNGLRLGGRSFMRRESTDPDRGRGSSSGHGKATRSSSISSSSVASTNSSTDSDSSVGSLPEHDDIGDQQLPAAKQSLLNWLHHPEQPVTQAVIQQVYHDIELAREAPMCGSELDKNILRKEVRELLKHFKDVKKRRQKEQKQARRERRAVRRERRTAKREAKKLKREGRGSKAKDTSRRSPWMTSRSTAELLQPPILPPRPVPELAPGFPFSRAASVPALHGPGSPRGGAISGSPAMHSTWPYARDAHSPGNLSSTRLTGLPGAFSTAADGSEHLYAQAKELEGVSKDKEEKAIELRTQATSRRTSDKERMKKLDEASSLEEEAEKYTQEAERLRVEALHMDGVVARELEETGRMRHTTSGIL